MNILIVRRLTPFSHQGVVHRMWQIWLIGIIGIWVAVSPWVYHFSTQTGALWNSLIFGVITLILAIWTGVVQKNKN